MSSWLAARVCVRGGQDAWAVFPQLLQSKMEAIQVYAAKGLYSKVGPLLHTLLRGSHPCLLPVVPCLWVCTCA